MSDNSDKKSFINNKVQSILDAITDEDALDSVEGDSDTSIIRDFSSLIDANNGEADHLIGEQLGHWTIKALIGQEAAHKKHNRQPYRI